LAERRRTGGLPIALRGVHVTHGATRVLDGVDFTLDAGPRTVVLGANGAGKSTLLRVLHGLVAPTTGTVRWAGAERRPRDQAMVFQRPVLLRRDAAANVRHALRLAGVRGAAADDRIGAALQAVGLGGLAHRAARSLSGGEQQRLALARAWALHPAVLFLDEPTANLDPAATREVERIVLSIHALGATIAMTTHSLAQARRVAQRIVFLHAGRITEVSDADDFFRAPASAEARQFLEGERL
jgi:tungstate transport system ATP-binding protein